MANTRTVTIHIEESNFSGDVSNFPALITRASLPNEMCDPSGSNKAKSDGGDLRAFVMVSSVKTAIPLEVFEFEYDSTTNAADAICNIYAKIPSILSAFGADLILEYGDGSLSQPAVTDSLGRNAVWTDAAYVTHDFIVDATGGSSDATQSGAIANTRTPNNLFAISTGNSAEGAWTGEVATNYTGAAADTDFSLLCVMKLQAGTSQFHYLGGQDGSWSMDMNTQERLDFYRVYSGTLLWRQNSAMPSGAWRSWIITMDSDAPSRPTAYINTSSSAWQSGNNPTPSGSPATASGTPLIIANLADGSGTAAWNGQLAEYWIWKSIVSQAFIDGYYAMTQTSSGFATAGTPADVSGGNDTIDVAFLSITGTQLTATLTDQGNVGFNVPYADISAGNFPTTLADQGNDSLTVPLFSSGLSLFAVTLSDSTNETIDLAFIASTSATYIPVLTDRGNDTFDASVLATTLTLYAVTLSDQGNDSITGSVVASSLLLYAQSITSQGNPVLDAPHLTVTPTLFTGTLTVQGNTAYTAPHSSLSTILILSPSLTSNPKIDVPYADISAGNFPVQLKNQNNKVFNVPARASALTMFAGVLTDQGNDTFGVEYLASTAALYDIDLLSNNQFLVAFIDSTLTLYAPSFASIANEALYADFLDASIVVYVPNLQVIPGDAFNVPFADISAGNFPVRLRNQTNKNFNVPYRPPLTSFSTPAFLVITENTIRVPNVLSSTVLSNPVLANQTNNTFVHYFMEVEDDGVRAFFAPILTGVVHDVIDVPVLPSTLQVLPQILGVAANILNVPGLAGTVQLFTADWSNQSNSSIVLAHRASTVVAHSQQISDTPPSMFVPFLDSTLNVRNQTLFAQGADNMVPTKIPSAETLYDVTLSDNGGITITPPFLGSTIAISPVQLKLQGIVVGTGERPRLTQLGYSVWGDYVGEHIYWNLRRYNDDLGKGTSYSVSVEQGKFNPVTGWMYVDPGLQSVLRPLIDSTMSLYGINVGIWSIVYEIIPNTGGGLGVENTTNTAGMVCSGFSAPVHLGGNRYKMTLDVTGITDGRQIQIVGNANGGWMKLEHYGPESYENTPDAFRPELVGYGAEYDVLRFMNWMGAINAKITRASDWLDNTDWMTEFPPSATPGTVPATNRDKLKFGIKFTTLLGYAVACDSIAHLCMPGMLGAHSNETSIWARSTYGTSFRDELAQPSVGSQIVSDMKFEWYQLGLKLFDAANLVNYPDNKPLLLEYGNEIWNSAYGASYWYCTGIGVYLKNTTGSGGSDNGIGHGYALAAMIDGLNQAKAQLKPNQEVYYVANIQTTTTFFRANGIAIGIGMYQNANPGHTVNKLDIFIGPTGYISGAFKYQNNGNWLGSTSAAQFAADWQAYYNANGETATFNAIVAWYTNPTLDVRDSVHSVTLDNIGYRDWAVSNGFRGILQYEGSFHDNLDGGGANSLLTLFPQSSGIWSRFVKSPQAEAIMDYALNRFSAIDPMNPAVTTGWRPKTLVMSNFREMGASVGPQNPWNERTPDEMYPFVPVTGATRSWYKSNRTLLPATGLDNTFYVPSHFADNVLHTPFFGPIQTTISPTPLVLGTLLFPPEFPTLGNDIFDAGPLNSTLQIYDPTILPNSRDTIVLPKLTLVTAFPSMNFDSAPNDSLVISTVVGVPTLNTPTLGESTNTNLLTPYKPSGFVGRTPTILSGVILNIELPYLPANSRAQENILIDSIVRQGHQDLETNPFPPNIPTELETALPPEAANYLQNLTETLREVYQRIQGGAVVFPSAVMQYVDDVAQFPVGTKAKFLHQNFGFIVAQYVHFYQDSALGAPIGLSKFNSDRVTSVFADAQDGSLLGLSAATSPTLAGKYGWVIVDGRNTIPVLTSVALNTGDELVWNASNAVTTNDSGTIVGHYRGPGIAAGQLIPAGDIDILREINVAGQLLSLLEGVNSQIQTLVVADENFAQLLSEVQVSLGSVTAAIQQEVQARITASGAMASRLDALGATLRGEITASYQAALQAFADEDATRIQLFEDFRSEFVGFLDPLNRSISQVSSSIVTLATAQSATSEAVNVMTAGIDANGLSIAGAITNIATINVQLAAQDAAINANASLIQTVQTSLASTDAQVAANASVITSQSAQISLINGQIATVQAQWGVTVDANNRVTGRIRLSATQSLSTFDVLADRFRVFNGIADKAVFEARGNKVYINGIPLNSGVLAEEGTRLLPIGVGVAQGGCRDGVGVSFSVNWADIPAVIFGAGGKQYEPSFGTIQEQAFSALNLSVSGFTPSLKVRDVTGVQTNRTNSGAAATTGGPTTRIVKTFGGTTVNDAYTYRYNVDVPQLPGEPGNRATARMYSRTSSGAAWVLRSTKAHTQSAANVGAVISISGLGVNAEFGMSMTWFGVAGAFAVSDFLSVSYVTTTGGSVTSATPSGIADVPFTVIGNQGVL